jgi:hypothetical protein
MNTKETYQLQAYQPLLLIAIGTVSRLLKLKDYFLE